MTDIIIRDLDFTGGRYYIFANKFVDMPSEGIPIELFDHIQILVNSYKSGKYPMNNWLEVDGKGMDDKSNLASMFRHLAKMTAGEVLDNDSGMEHDLHLAIRSMMRYTRRKKGLVHKDDQTCLVNINVPKDRTIEHEISKLVAKEIKKNWLQRIKADQQVDAEMLQKVRDDQNKEDK